MVQRNDPPGGRARIDELMIPVECPGDLGVPCGSGAWVLEVLHVYLVHRLALQDRQKDQQLPARARWRCALCGRILEDKDFENLKAGPAT